ncbi:hypothetical protein HYH03_018824 [Edaphochlamys debaryana]|uniref:Cytochrome P450 n=1 Tax=Edaphochlamys debaryana TaxID=47281 RepID=A0A836BNZ8_9CHLO|nr:hypothetical protein HYH03_018824 [Edaphochlamys debaryana]|eukprot:KAG2482244.1 hypothetical protein HYH03_018824 [Edaphochlamys debaryana]
MADHGDLSKLPSPPASSWLLGHVPDLLRPDYHRVILQWANKYGKAFRVRVLTEWTVVVADPALAAQALTHIPGRTANYTLIDEVCGGPGVVSMFGTLDEEAWRNTRKATAPAFSMANVRRYYGGVLSSAGELLEAIDREQAALGWVEAEPLLQRLMLRATLEGLFEVPDATQVPGFDTLATNITLLMTEANAQITDPIRKAFYATPLAPLLSKHVARCRTALKSIVAFHTNTATRVLSRPEPEPGNTLLWACLHRLRHPRTGRPLTPKQLHPEVGMYTTAGFDTTTSSTGWCMYAAAMQPSEQEAVARELREAGVFGRGAVLEAEREEEGGAEYGEGDGEGQEGAANRGPRRLLRLDPGRCPGPEELARLPRLNAFINEVLRMYSPTALAAERQVGDQPVRLGGLAGGGPARAPGGPGAAPTHHRLAHDLPPLPPSPLPLCLPPPYPLTGRQVGDQPVRLGGLVLPPRTTVWPMTYALHMGADNWGDPEAFRPDRWLEDPRCAFARQGVDGGPQEAAGVGAAEGGPRSEEPPRRFLPFGAGPKNCVGQNFGHTVLRSLVGLLLSRYVVRLGPDMGPDGPSAEETAVLTQVAVITKLRRLRLRFQPRD